jgi:hypothetical protein
LKAGSKEYGKCLQVLTDGKKEVEPFQVLHKLWPSSFLTLAGNEPRIAVVFYGLQQNISVLMC